MKLKKIWEIPFQIFFWAFNIGLIFVVYLAILPFLISGFIVDALAGELPLDFFLPLIGLVAVPTASSMLSRLPAYRQPVSLLQVFYGVEAPLLILCTIRFFFLRELNPGVSLILLTGLLAIASYLYRLIKGDREDKFAAWMQLISQSLMLVIACYLGILTLFYGLPIVWAFLAGVIHIITHIEALTSFLSALPLMLAYSAPIIVFLSILIALGTAPFGLVILYLKSWRSHLNNFTQRFGALPGILGTTGAIFGWIFLLLILQKQPQVWALSALSQPVKTPEARQALVDKSPQIREGLLNAYLSRYRYVDSSDRPTGIGYLYQSVFGLDTPTRDSLDNIYKSLFSPFLYQGKASDSDKAEELYAKFFDTPILRAEREKISQAVGATWNRTEAKAGLLDINEKRVWLKEQKVTVKPHQNWGEVEIYEVYENKTLSQQEVVYSFSLPESAVMTGVWLGNSSDRSLAFPFTVSPRGAAQQVYTQEVNRRVDPALLEQIGPRNYRLRAYPVLTTAPLHLWLKYQVLQAENGNLPLPQLSEKRNIFWTKDTKRTYNGKSIKNVDSDAWFADTAGSKLAKKTTLTAAIPGYQVTAKPLDRADLFLPQGKKVAVVLDTSYSMGREADRVQKSADWLRSQLATSNDIDLYLTASEGGTSQRIDDLQGLDLNKVVFYGTLQPYQMLKQFTQLQAGSNYDAIVLLTDKGSYELSDENNKIPKPPAPLWMVHLGGIQPAYDDATFDAIQATGGGVGSEISEVMERMATQKALVANITDGYAWEVREQNSDVNASVVRDDVAPFAAREVISYLASQRDLNDVKSLDEVHKIAKNSQIVSPYSSMIVLVDDRQRQALKDAEKQSDRFQREVEDKQLPKPQNNLSIPNVTATPEPEEWMLIAVAGLGLGTIAYRSRLQLAQSK